MLTMRSVTAAAAVAVLGACGGSGGSGGPTLSPPAGLTYSANPAAYTRGTAIAANSPSSSGGAVASYSVSPALPTGLALNTVTGTITGTPTTLVAAANYTVTASNASGSTTATLSIAVNEAPPTGLSYATNPVVYEKGTVTAPNLATSHGGPVASYSVVPSLPTGLSLDPATGAVTGTPIAVAAAADYLVTAINSGGTASVALSITVNDIPPTDLSYSSNLVTYTKGTAIPANMPTNSGGAVVTYSVSPSLPPGLSINLASGFITGTPTKVTSAATYTVTATNSGGSTNAALTITVNDAAPTALTYLINPAIYTKGTATSPNTPSNAGGAVVGYAVVPNLPAGLAIDPSTGAISGTPSAISGTGTYTVTASNSGGNTTGILSLTVNDVPPSTLRYSTNPAICTKGTAVAANAPSNSGGAVVSYTVSPSLPSGLSINPASGSLTGTPSAVTPSAIYTVTATNSGGSTTASVSITVNDVPPSVLAYSTSPAIYTKGSAISDNVPTSSGGPVVLYSVAPNLPAGLSIDLASGVITGTPTQISTAATFAVTASNSGGSTTANLSITVNDVRPSGLTYSTTSAVYTRGSAIVANTPSSSGGAVISYSVAPALPAGLALSTVSGAITGTPTSLATVGTYTVTATNSGGSTSASVSITVNDVPPSALAYSQNPATYTVGAAVPANTPSSLGGPVVSYSISPALPTGLTFSTSSGAIGGTTLVMADSTHTVTARNSGGSTTVNLSIRMLPPPAPLITSQPANQITLPGQTAFYGVLASGTGPITYQWYRDGAAITGEVYPYYTTLPVSFADNEAFFYAVASDTYGGSVITDLATLTVQGFTPTGPTSTARALARPVRLLDGRVLVAGPGITAEVFDPSTGTFTATAGNLTTHREWHTATLLPNGKVLLTGGVNPSTPVASAEIFDPATGLFAPTGSMAKSRFLHSAILLDNGKVLVAGGAVGGAPTTPAAELYDFATGLFTPTGSMATPRAYFTATKLANGRILVTGGVSTVINDSAEIYDPGSGSFLATGSLVNARYLHTAVLLPSGAVLVAGGSDDNGLAPNRAEIYSPTTGLFAATGTMLTGRYAHTATLLPRGEVLLAGGDTAAGPTANAEIYNPTSRTFTATRSMAYARHYHGATLLLDGTVLIEGGYVTSSELFLSAP